MGCTRSVRLALVGCLAGILAGAAAAPLARAASAQTATQPAPQQPQPGPSEPLATEPEAPLTPPLPRNPAERRVVGKIESIVGRMVTIAPAPGLNVIVLVPDDARMVRIEPGELNLQNAAPVRPSDLQVGDHIVVQGTLSDDNTGLVASSIILMKHYEPPKTEARKNAPGPDLLMMKQDWLKRGVGGVVTGVDQTTGVVKIAAATATGTRSIAVHKTSDTMVRLYASDSVKLEDAQPGAFGQIQPGDLVQARGSHSRDGLDLTADEIIFGEFRNITGTIDSVDPASGSLRVTELATKQPVVVTVTLLTQIRKLPVAAAQDIAARLKTAAQESRSAAESAPRRGAGPAAAQAGAQIGGQNADEPWLGAAQADFEQTVSQMPPATLRDLQPGDALMIVGTPNKDSGGVTAAILVGGMEPIVTSSLDQGVPLTISPWDLGTEAGNEVIANP